MCDYSLENIASRAAQVGERLVSTQFVNSLTRGFAAIGEPNVAVCLLPGTEVVFAKEAQHRNPLVRLFRRIAGRKPRGKVARFRQLNLDNPQTHHDALEFADGKVLLLTLLRPGQRATVLQLPVQTSPKATETRSVDETSGQQGLVLISR